MAVYTYDYVVCRRVNKIFVYKYNGKGNTVWDENICVKHNDNNMRGIIVKDVSESDENIAV